MPCKSWQNQGAQIVILSVLEVLKVDTLLDTLCTDICWNNLRTLQTSVTNSNIANIDCCITILIRIGKFSYQNFIQENKIALN